MFMIFSFLKFVSMGVKRFKISSKLEGFSFGIKMFKVISVFVMMKLLKLVGKVLNSLFIK